MDTPLAERHGPMAWERSTLLADEGVLVLDESCIEELRNAAAWLTANPLPTEALRADDLPLDAIKARMADVREALDNGIGFAIIDRIPVDEMTPHIATQVYWLMMDVLGRPVAQKWDGTLVYDVLDTGRTPAPGNGVRSSKSNQGQGYHTDNSFNTPPEHVALFCIRPAKEGGLSGLISLDSVYNRLLAEYPDTIPRLFEPFVFDRQREHAPDDQLTSQKPMFETVNGELCVSLSTGLVYQGHKLANEPMDAKTQAALDALDAVMEDAELGKTFDFEPGQIQVVNNRRLGHRRTGFVDWPDEDRRRHLVRIWLRNDGQRSYHG